MDLEGVDFPLVTAAFEEMARLEKIFNFFDPSSTLSSFNRGESVRSAEFFELLSICRQLESSASGAFAPYRDGALDLSGIAKGFIVEQTFAWLFKRCPDARGSIAAGGDVAFRGPPGRVTLRLGNRAAPVTRELSLSRSAIASSSIGAFTDLETSGTRYFLSPTRPVGATVVVQAGSLTLADALTKVILFGPADVIQSCCEIYSALALVFDVRGELIESFGQI